jgi:uncharacterized protein
MVHWDAEDNAMSTLILVGASVRAAAMSARRAGFTPWCIDLFCDTDLRQLTRNAYRCPAGEWPQGLLPILKDAPQAPWIYTGGLENHPNLIRELAEVRPLWGNGPNELLKSRSPFNVWKLLNEAGLPCLEVRDADAELPGYCEWLRKPLRSCGGGDIRRVTTPLPEAEARERNVYHQQMAEGEPYSSVFVGDGYEEAKLLGSTRQLIGQSWLNATGFQYCGNLGPVDPAPEVRATLWRIGQVLVEGCKLKGLFGIDWVLANEQPWLVEVNPRYPASLEILELHQYDHYFQYHASSFDPRVVPPPPPGGRPSKVGKAVFYADRDFTMPRMGFPCTVHDVPSPGEFVQSGTPVLTLLAWGNTVSECEHDLKEFAASFRESLNRNLLFGPKRWREWLDEEYFREWLNDTKDQHDPQ